MEKRGRTCAIAAVKIVDRRSALSYNAQSRICGRKEIGVSELPRVHPIIYPVTLWVSRAVLELYVGLTVEGKSHVPAQETGMIMAVNHSSFLDLFALGVAVRKPIYFPLKREAIDDARIGWLMRGIGGFPVDREVLDVSVARIMMGHLRAGRFVGIAPEGTRSPTNEVQPFKTGFLKLAIKARVPVMLAAIHGAYEAAPKGRRMPKRSRVTVRLGEPIDLSEYYGQKLAEKDYQSLAEKMRHEMLDMLADIKKLRN
jgi:1-acyl-sn-glycerol-3-phosphate acyltransferase